MKNRGSRREAVGGFSLIELMVVIAIAGILLTVTWARISTLVPIYRLEGAARALAAEIQRARGRAITENKCFMVHVNTVAKTYQLQNKAVATLPCGTTGFSADAADGAKKIDDANSLTVAFSAGSNPVFNPRGTLETSPAPVIALQNSANAFRSVYVQPTGRINVQ